MIIFFFQKLFPITESLKAFKIKILTCYIIQKIISYLNLPFLMNKLNESIVNTYFDANKPTNKLLVFDHRMGINFINKY